MTALIVNCSNIFPNSKLITDDFTLDCSNENDVINNYIQIMQYPDMYMKYLHDQMYNTITDYLSNSDNVNDIAKEYNQINEQNKLEIQKIDDKRTKAKKLCNEYQAKTWCEVSPRDKRIFDRKIHVIVKRLSKYLNQHSEKWQFKDFFDFIENKLLHILVQKYNLNKVQNYLICSKDIIMSATTIIYEVIYHKHLFSNEILQSLKHIDYKDPPEHIMTVISQSIRDIGIVDTFGEIRENSKIIDYLKTIIKYCQDLSLIFNFEKFLELSYDKAEVYINSIKSTILSVFCNNNDPLSLDNILKIYLGYIKTSLQEYLAIILNDISDHDDIIPILHNLLICSILCTDIDLGKNKELMMTYLLKHGIDNNYTNMYAIIYKDFPKYLSENWKLYLQNTDIADDIFAKVNFPNKECFLAKALAWKEMEKANSNFKDMNLTIKSRHDDNNLITIDRSKVSLDINENSCVVSKVAPESFVPSLRKYVSVIYAFCDKRYNGGENEIDFKKSTITITINDISIKRSAFQINVILAVISLNNPTISDVIHMLNYSTLMITTLKSLINETVLIKEDNVIKFNSKYFQQSLPTSHKVDNEETVDSSIINVIENDPIMKQVVELFSTVAKERKLKSLEKNEIIGLIKSFKLHTNMKKNDMLTMFSTVMKHPNIKAHKLKVKKSKQAYVM